MKQPTLAPHSKVSAAAIAGAVSVLLVALLNHYAGMTLGTVEAQAITVLLSGAAGYFKEE